MDESKTFELCAQVMMAESRAAAKNVEGRLAQEFFQTMLGLHFDLEESYRAWREILERWEEAKSRGGPSAGFREVLLNYMLQSGQLADPIVTEFTEFQRLRLSSTTDHLTDTFNRRFFDLVLAKEVPRAARYAEDLNLVLFDLNRFKEVNDTHGHPFGDRLLALAGKVLKGILRVSDSAYRVGGDEFALVLPQTSHVGALTLSERIRQRFAEEVKRLGELQVPVSLAYGVASCPREASDPQALFALADQRLYDFKRSIGSPRCAPRRCKRIPTAELEAYVVLRTENMVREGRLLDFSFGGVALRLAEEVALPETLVGDLHLPVLPTASVSMRKVYAVPEEGHGLRVGCAFLEALTPPIELPPFQS